MELANAQGMCCALDIFTITAIRHKLHPKMFAKALIIIEPKWSAHAVLATNPDHIQLRNVTLG